VGPPRPWGGGAPPAGPGGPGPGKPGPVGGGGGGVDFLVSDWFAQVPPEPFDLVVSNPPYLSIEETAQTAPEVRGFEPVEALTAADNGVADLARIIAEGSSHLQPGGLLALETGIAQHTRLIDLANRAGFSRVESHRDLTGRDRFILAFSPAAADGPGQAGSPASQ